MRPFWTRQRAAIVQLLAHSLLALAGILLVVSCASSFPPLSVEPVVTVSASSPPTRATLVASPAPVTVEPPRNTATPVTVTVEPSRTIAPVKTTVEPADETATPTATVPVCKVRVVNTFPHDRSAYTQGLVFESGILYEGTGLHEHSTLRRVDLESGDVLQALSLPPEYFGEGITIWEDRIIQLTWQSRLGFVYDKDSFELLDTFGYPTEGWGITHDGKQLIMSDGTQTLHFWDPDTLVETGSVEVHTSAGPVTRLNELEYIQGMVFANVWQTDFIAVIDPRTGQVTAWIDLQGLLEPEDYAEPVSVLNGIAYDASSERLFVTGKLWPKLFEIELISPTGAPAPITCK